MTEPMDIPIEHGIMNSLNLPEDAYECQIIEINPDKRVNKLKKKEELGGVFLFEIMTGPYKGKQFQQFFTNKFTKRSKLSVLARAIWGKELEPEETAQLEVMTDLRRFLIRKPLNVVMLIRHSALTDSIWYDVAFFFKSEFFDEEKNRVIIPK